MDEEKKLDDILKERLQELPKPVRDAIASAEVEKKLQGLAEHHKLHLDKWDILENEVMLTLLGLEPIENLQENIKNEVDVPEEVASALTEDISKAIFEPIRQELEQELPPQEEAPSAESVVDTASTAATVQKTAPAPEPVPSTPPPPPKTEKAIRAPISESYTSQTPSHERKAIEGDPYREAIA